VAGLEMRRYLHESGRSADDCAEVARRNRAHAATNPRAAYADVADPTPLFDPLTREQAATSTDGCVVAVLAAEDRGRLLSARSRPTSHDATRGLEVAPRLVAVPHQQLALRLHVQHERLVLGRAGGHLVFGERAHGLDVARGELRERDRRLAHRTPGRQQGYQCEPALCELAPGLDLAAHGPVGQRLMTDFVDSVFIS